MTMRLAPDDLHKLHRIASKALDEAFHVLQHAAERETRIEREIAEAGGKAIQSQPTADAAKLEGRLTFSVKEASAMLGVSRTSVWRYVRDGKLNSIRVGSRTLIRAVDLYKLIGLG